MPSPVQNVTLIQAGASLIAGGGVLLVIPMAILLLGLPVVLTVRAFIEALPLGAGMTRVRVTERGAARMKMGIHVVGDAEAITAQTRAYAEYRLFSVLAGHTHRVSRARIVLQHRPGTHGICTCEVTLLLLVKRRRMRIRAQGLHPYAAIDRAIARVAVARVWQEEAALP